MGLIKETINHPTIDDVEITVDEHAKDETREPYDIISLDISFSSIRQPDDLVELGKWLVEQGTRIKHKYSSKGWSTVNKKLDKVGKYFLYLPNFLNF